MSIVNAENVDQFGRFTIVTREIGDDGLVTSVHREPISPGHWEDGAWVETDTSDLSPVVQAFAAQVWTVAAVDRFKAAFPWNAPAPLTPETAPLSMRQLRLGLIQFGGKSASFIQDLINAMPSPQKDFAQVWYDETAIVHWDHAETQTFLGASGISEDAARQMWMAAKAAFPE